MKQDGFDPTDVEDAYLIDSNPDDFAADVRLVARGTIEDAETLA